MVAIINFIWQSIFCLSFFYAFYWVFLKDEKTFFFNRVYLLIAPVLAIAFSLIEIPVSFEKPSISLENTAFLKAFDTGVTNEIMGTYGLPEVTVTGSRLPVLWETIDYLFLGYIFIVVILLVKLYWQYLQLKEVLRKGWYQTVYILKDSYFKVPTFGFAPVFSYFNKIFWDDTQNLNGKEETQILQHELEHVKQKHSYDIFFYQMLSIVFWFNPIIHLMRLALIDLHEFQADAKVLKHAELRDTYPKLVAKMAFQGLDLPLGNYFIRSTTLKRIIMMKTNKKTSWFKLVMLVPLLAMLFGLVSMKSSSSIISFNKYTTLPVSLLKHQIESFRDSIAVGINLKSVKNPIHYESIGMLQDESLNVQVGELSYEFTGIKNKEAYFKVLGLVESLRPNSRLYKKYENAYLFQDADQKPAPEGGWEAWENYLSAQLPLELKGEDLINGRTIELEFVVDQEANIIDPTIKKSIGKKVDQALLTALMHPNGPLWSPGKIGGKTVAVVVNAKIGLPAQKNEMPVENLSLQSAPKRIDSAAQNPSKSFPENLGPGLQDDLKSGAIVLGDSFKKHLSKSLAFPKNAFNEGISGTVILKLSTNSSGKLTDVSFIKRIHPSIEENLLEALANAPNLKPIIQKNNYELLLPVSFRIIGSNTNEITPNLNKAYGDNIKINAYKKQDKRFIRDPFNSPLKIPVHIIKADLLYFNGVLMPIQGDLGQLIKNHIIFNAIKVQSVTIQFSAAKGIKMGTVQNVQEAIRKAGLNKITFNKEAAELMAYPEHLPLFIIDGETQTDPANINYPKPEEIASISVVGEGQLKLYGTKAKNGVIIIKTKKGLNN